MRKFGLFWLMCASLYAQPSLRITSPAQGAVFSPGQAIPVTVSTSGEISGVSIFAEQPLGFSAVALAAPYQFSIPIPLAITPKKYTLIAIGMDNKGAVTSAPITIVVQRLDSPVSLKVEPPTMELNIGNHRSLRVTGTYLDGSILDLTNAESNLFSSSAPAIVNVDARGSVTALSAGDAEIIVNGSAKVRIRVPPAMKILPVRMTLYASESQRFFPQMADRSSPAAIWLIQTPGVGIVSESGVYTAPSAIGSSQTVVLKAIAVSNQTISATAAITLLPGKRPESARPSCDQIRQQPKGHITTIDMVPDLMLEPGMITDPEVLATGGRPVTGVAGAAIVLLRFKANFAGERLQVTVVNDDGAISASAREDGALAEVPGAESGTPMSFESMRFVPGKLTITAKKSSEGAIGFALYRGPEDFVRKASDENKSNRPISLRVESLDLPCLMQPLAHR